VFWGVYVIKTERLLIRKVLPGDWKDLYDYLSLEEIYHFEPGTPCSIDEAKSIAAERACSNSFFAVVLKESDKLIGHLYFHQTQPLEWMSWELGYIFNPNYQSQGYCTEASKALIAFAFCHWNAHRICAYCNPDNHASWKVLEKLGMRREGFFKQKGFFRRDENNQPLWHDCYAYGLLNKKSEGNH